VFSLTRRASQERGKVTSLGRALQKLLRSWGIESRVRENQAAMCWSEAVGPRIAEQTEALGVEDGKVFVRVRSSSWKTELVFMKPKIIDRLNQAVGKEVIKDIVFVGNGGRGRSFPETKTAD
jgi:predicted nucleic acid-binding Zn ribbon protein